MKKSLARRGLISMFIARCLIVMLIISCIPVLSASADPEASKPRLLVTSDIGGDPDDRQSMVRLMCYSNEFDIEGYVCTALAKDKGEGLGPHPKYANEIITEYGKVRDNLLLHKSGYPTEAYLKSIVKTGATARDLFGNANQDTEGSNWIITCADKDDPRPLNIAVWGGATELAQALWKVKNTRSAAEFEKFVSKLRVYSINKQDTGVDWLINNVPNLFMVVSYMPVGSTTEQAFRGMYDGGDTTIANKEWIDTNVINNHGALGTKYPYATNARKFKEGDTPSMFYFLSDVIGLSNADHPNWGGWGGRYAKLSGNVWADTQDTVGGVTNYLATVWRWRPDYQNDFAARMDWCVKSYAQANHNPVAVVKGALTRTVGPNTQVKLDATASTDPDGNTLSYEWMYYKEAGNYASNISINNNTAATADFTAPSVSVPTQIHIILRVKDNGSPSLVGYKRVVVNVDPSLPAGYESAGSNLYVQDVNAQWNGSNISVSGTVGNNGQSDKTYWTIIALYNAEGKLTGVKYSSATVGKQDTDSINLNFDNVSNADRAKMFIWLPTEILEPIYTTDIEK
ncbi:MAG: REJ domain protein [Firmicutes bacterium ADurb.Bin193]|nr:MAG: REJ domain protein [Firmicutes bacterium ADurb.Bin193]